VAAYAEVEGTQLKLKALSFAKGPVRQAQGAGSSDRAVELGQQLAAELKSSSSRRFAPTSLAHAPSVALEVLTSYTETR
jgi:hypothetical protein